MSEQSSVERILYFLLAALIASLAFEFRYFPVMSNLQWLFLAVSAAALPILIREKNKLFRDRLVIAALVFVITQWLAALFSTEFTLNAIKGAVRVTAGFTLLCATLCVRDRPVLLRVFGISAVVAALYGILDYAGFGLPRLFRDVEFWFGPAMRLSGSFEYPNTAAAFFGISLPIVWTTLKVRWVRVVGSLLVWIALIMTYSRGATIAVLLIMLIWVFVGRARLASFFVALCAGVFAIFLLFEPTLIARFQAAQPVKEMSAEYQPEFNRLGRHPDEASDLLIRIKNIGTAPWLVEDNRPLTLTYRWYDPEGRKLVRSATNYTPIPVPVRPQESIAIRASFRTPLQPGLYLLTWDISKSGVGWFSGNGVPPGLVEVDIRKEAEPWSDNGDLSRWYRREISSLFVTNVPYSRRELWRAAADMAIQHPILGVGPDNFRLLYGRVFGESGWDTNIRSNSLYLELLSGSGLAGLAAFGLMMAAVRRSAAAPTLALAIFLVHGLVDVFLMTTPIYFAFWILLAQAHHLKDEAITPQKRYNTLNRQETTLPLF
jgi:hypothetical protein